MAFTYEQIEELGTRALGRFCNQKYEMLELVNEVWIAGRAKKAMKTSHCINLMRLDAIDYMRKCEGRVINGRPQARKRVRFDSMQAIVDRMSHEGDREIDPFVSDCHEPIEHAVGGELRDRLLCGLSRLEKLTMTMRWDGFTCREIGHVAGYTESHIFYIQKRTLTRCRERVESMKWNQ